MTTKKGAFNQSNQKNKISFAFFFKSYKTMAKKKKKIIFLHSLQFCCQNFWISKKKS